MRAYSQGIPPTRFLLKHCWDPGNRPKNRREKTVEVTLRLTESSHGCGVFQFLGETFLAPVELL